VAQRPDAQAGGEPPCKSSASTSKACSCPRSGSPSAERTGIAEFRRTTRDEPDYDKLMRWRLALLRQHGLKLADIQAVIAAWRRWPAPRTSSTTLRTRYQVIILSDTFYEFADPLMRSWAAPRCSATGCRPTPTASWPPTGCASPTRSATRSTR
jgi:hypothetical protein